MIRVPRPNLDGFTLALLATVGLASLLPLQGAAADGVHWVAEAAIALLFFLHGARLPREEVTAGLSHWRLHLLIVSLTFLAFPLIGWLVVETMPERLLPPALAIGVQFLCLLPSTVQSSIAFTSMARGNVAAAVCSATLSNIAGILMTPLLVALFLKAQGGGFSLDAIQTIVVQLLLPFVAGQLLRRWVGAWAARHKGLLKVTDRGSILLVVYIAFSEAVAGGLWTQVPPEALAMVVLVDCAILALFLVGTTLLSRRLGFSTADETAIVFCGSKKSLVSGVPMAGVLFAPATAGLVLLPVMIFHQIQLMVCAVLARRYADREAAERDALPAAS
ncbi:bile acid:sodium symporter family protein [Azospirillum agricola]|uniref:bile acid:sodium symporter family protein n=1 Tax=Azospirillum agricola TaxID=1720247 RepID=UPI000A0F0CA3|nr:bile acid:sodium symporter family protein [Azospirillum agricola]SMH48366.1 solute carrier family 10 (sodium/bile acid cotransporter), member 7 [Azospirillum lipoferum]